MSSSRLQSVAQSIAFCALGALAALSACNGDIAGMPGGTGPGMNGTGGTSGPPPAPGSKDIGTVDIMNQPNKTIARLTNAQWINATTVLMGDAAVAGAAALLPEQDRHGAFRNTGYAQDQPFDLIQAFDAAATYVVGHVASWPAFHMRWGGCTQASCVSTFIRAFAEAAFRRPVVDADVTAFQPILTAAMTASLTYDETVQLLVRATLQAPDFLYQIASDNLTDYQLASRVSFFISDGPPDAELYAAAKSGDIHTPAGLDKQVDRLLAANVTRFATAFGYDYLDLHRATTRNLMTDPMNVLALMDSATASFASLVQQDKPVDSILTLDTFVTNPIAATWIAGKPSMDATVKPNPSYPFLGLLTHPAALMAMSNSVFGSTVSRGSFIANQMLCVPPTPPPPPGIQQTDLSALLPPNPTQRDEAEARIKDSRCMGCHAQFESYSFAFNKWGGDGTYKTDPALKDGGPIKSGLGDIAFASYADFLPKLAGSTQFHRCVTDQVVRYGLQHTEYTEDVTNAVLADAYKQNPTVTFRSLMKALIRQSIFKTR